MATHVPAKHQSVSPGRGVVVGLVALLVMFAAVWFAVSAAVDHGGERCAMTSENTHAIPARCR